MEPRGTADFSLSARLQLMVVALVLILVVGGVTVLATVGTGDRSLDRIVSDLDPAREAVGRLSAALIDQQAAVSGYALTKREETLEPYRRGVEREQAAMRTLRRTVGDEPGMSRRLETIEQRVRSWRTEVALPQISAIRGGSEAESRAISATGESSFEQARGAVDFLSGDIDEELLEVQRRNGRVRQRITRGIAVNFGVALGLVLLATIYLRRWVTIPLETLRQSVSAIEHGDLERPIEASGSREMAEVGRAVEAMRDRILAELKESERSREALAQQAPVVVALREILAPPDLVVPPRFEFASHFDPAEGVLAGDWFHLVSVGEGKVGLCLGDVAGHGALPGLFALRARELIMVGMSLGLDPGAILEMVAGQLGELDETFLTCVLAIVETSGTRATMRYANAGHPPPLVVSSGRVTPLDVTGPLLGPLAGLWSSAEVELPEDWVLACYTDGVVEADDGHGDEFGVERLTEVLLAAHGRGPTAMVEDAVVAVRGHLGDRARDDLTLVALALAAARS